MNEGCESSNCRMIRVHRLLRQDSDSGSQHRYKRKKEGQGPCRIPEPSRAPVMQDTDSSSSSTRLRIEVVTQIRWLSLTRERDRKLQRARQTMITEDTADGVQEPSSVEGILTYRSLGPGTFVRGCTNWCRAATTGKCIDGSCIEVDNVIGVDTEVVGACNWGCEVSAEHECVVVRVVCYTGPTGYG